MRARALKCYTGNYDGQRDGMIFAASAVEASALIHCSLYHFQQYWIVRPLPWPLPNGKNPKVLTLYTRKNDYHSEWQEGICEI